MTHLDEARLLDLRDRNLEDPDAEAHLAACAPCREALAALEGRAARVGSALAALDLDDDAWDLEAARAAVRAGVARLTAADAEGASVVRPAPPRRWALGRAAAVLLFLGATASALPGSPVRDWLSVLLTPGALQVTEEAGPAAPAAEERPAAAAADRGTGIRLAVSGALQVSLLGLGGDQEVTVRWVPGDEAAVLAPTGSRFSSTDGRIEAVVERGPVTVEVPASATTATLDVGGRMYVRRVGETLDVSGPVVERDGARILFRTPPR